MNIHGADELSKKLKNMVKKAKELDGTNKVNLLELFNDNFMLSNTQFSSFEAFAKSSEFDWSNIEGIPENELDEFIAKNSKFNSWKEMYKEAGISYSAKQLGF